jgi:hypothetical protein
MDSAIELNLKGTSYEYNKGFFIAAYVYANTHIYLLYIYHREGKE